MAYKCESCGEYYDEPYCEKEGRELTQEVDDAAVPKDAFEAMMARSAATLAPTPAARRREHTETRAVPRTQAAPPRRERPREIVRETPPAEPPVQDTPQAPAQTAIPGLRQFNAYLEEGREAIVICGRSQTGKSEIASGYVRASTEFRGRAEVQMLGSSKLQYTVGGTNPFEIWYQPAGARHVFLDPSGEFFNRLSERRDEIDDYFFDFVRSAVAKLAGIVLVFDLTKAGSRDHSEWLEQERDFLFVLAALRWLRFDKTTRPQALGVRDTIAGRAARLPRLDVPVVVFFSKGDLVPDYTRQSPLRFAKRNLRTLHGALMSHAKRYRYDFCHTMKGIGGDARSVDPCGVLLPLEWLMDDRFRWIPRAPSYLLGGAK